MCCVWRAHTAEPLNVWFTRWSCSSFPFIPQLYALPWIPFHHLHKLFCAAENSLRTHNRSRVGNSNADIFYAEQQHLKFETIFILFAATSTTCHLHCSAGRWTWIDCKTISFSLTSMEGNSFLWGQLFDRTPSFVMSLRNAEKWQQFDWFIVDCSNLEYARGAVISHRDFLIGLSLLPLLLLIVHSTTNNCVLERRREWSDVEEDCAQTIISNYLQSNDLWVVRNF